VFDSLAKRGMNARELAEDRALDPTGTEALLTALATLGYLETDADGRYHATAAGASLASGSPDTVHDFIGTYNAHAWEMLGRLDELLRGETVTSSHGRPAGDPFWDGYIRGLFELTRAERDEAARLLPTPHPRTMLDLAGGHGGFAMAMCRRHPGLQATVLDLEASVRVGERIVSEQGLADRVSFRAGDALKDELGEQLDVISIFNLLHHLAPESVRELLGRAWQALADGGWVAIGETLRTEPGEPVSVNGAMSGLVYYASSGTRNYTRNEIVGWLREAGFADVEVHPSGTSPWRVLYLARR